MSNTVNSPLDKRPWWSYGHVWLVISGPLIVVLASFTTFYLAAHGQDPVLNPSNAETHSSATTDDRASLAPAVQARNHAATGALPTTDSKNKP
jgi:hypothetical protein